MYDRNGALMLYNCYLIRPCHFCSRADASHHVSHTISLPPTIIIMYYHIIHHLLIVRHINNHVHNCYGHKVFV